MAKVLTSSGATLDLDELDDVGAQPKPKAPVEYDWFAPGSQSEAVVRGASNAATLGLGKYIGGWINGQINGDPNAVQNEVAANARSQTENPWTYGGAGVVGGAAGGALGAGKSLLTNMALQGGASGLTALADTQDPTTALQATALGAVLPAAGAAVRALPTVIPKANTQVLDWIAKKTGAKEGAVNQIAEDAGKLGSPSSTANKALKAVNATPGTKTIPIPSKADAEALKTAIQETGLDALSPEYKSVIAGITPQAGIKDTLVHGYKEYGKGAAYGAGIGSLATPVIGPTGTAVGAALGGTVGLAKAAKNSLVNREVHKALSPAAKAGAQQLAKKMEQNAVGDAAEGATNAAKFGTISNFLNQTSPQFRALANPDNPQNQGQEEQ